MKTVHIPYINNFYKPEPNGMIAVTDISKIKKQAQLLIKELYNTTLKDDPLFHFFNEGDCLIIRISEDKILDRIRYELTSKKISFEEYVYPHAPQGKYGDGGVVEKYLKIFLPVLHVHAVAALIMSEEEHDSYRERVIHTAFNPKFMTYQEEGEKLKELAEKKLRKKL